MNRILAVILGIVLLGIGTLTGGCSLFFSPFIIGGQGPDVGILLIWLSGLVIGGLAIWGAVRLFRSGGR